MGKEILSHCRLTVSDGIKCTDLTQFEPITGAGFRITSVFPFVIEKDSTSKEDLTKLADLLTSLDKHQERSNRTTRTDAGNEICSESREQEEGASRSTPQRSTPAEKVDILESEEDYVMKKHQFYLAGEYFKDRDWKELLGKAEETDEGFCLRGKNVSADECYLLQILRKIAFETIGISEDQTHRVKEAAEYINCVDHGVCVIDYNSRPYIVGPKAQVHAAKEEILYKLREDGVDCHLTSLKALSMNDGGNNNDRTDHTVFGTVGAESVRNEINFSETESDDEDNRIEYIIRKTPFRLARKYFEGCPEHQYFDKAEKREEGHLFGFSNKNTKGTSFLKALRKLKFEIVGHTNDENSKLEVIADHLKNEMFDVRLLENGSKSFLVGPKEKMSEVKQKFMSKLQETDADDNILDTRETPRRQRSQPDNMRGVTDSSTRFSDGGARPKNVDYAGAKPKYFDSTGARVKNFDGYNSSHQRRPRRQSSQPEERTDIDSFSRPSSDYARPKLFGGFTSSQCDSFHEPRRDYTSRSLYQGDPLVVYSRDSDPGVYTGHFSGIKVHIHKTDITKLPVECIVSAANTRLKHGGGVTRVIATAAGIELQEACERFINAGNTVPVTGVFVSPGGRLPAKHVLHAVGPKWDLYNDQKKCTDDLRRTVLRCLVEAMRLGISSIALPSISAAIFRVPKELCACSYMEAVKSFDVIFGQDKDCTLKEVHFVDVDDIMVHYIQESFMKHWGEPCDSAMIRMDERFFQDYLSSKRPLQPRSGTPSASQNPWKPASQEYQTKRPVIYSAPQAKQSGAGSQTFEVETEYQIGRIRLCISTKPALSFDTDPIITIGEEFDKLSGTEDYKIQSNRKQCKDHFSQKNVFVFTYLCKPDGKQQRLVCTLYPEPKSPADIKSAVDKVDVGLRMSSLKGGVRKDVTSFVLTSSILYAEPNNNKQDSSKSIVPNLVGSLALGVCEYLDTASQDRSMSLDRVVITASKDAIPHLCKVFESRDLVKKVL